MVATNDDILKAIKDLKTVVEPDNMNLQVGGYASILSASATTTNIPLNPNYYHDVLLSLIGGTSTNTKVYVQFVTEQPQLPATFVLNTTKSTLLLRGVKIVNISSDSTLTSGQVLNAYYLGYKNQKNIELSE